MTSANSKRLRRIRIVGGRLLASVGLKGFARNHLGSVRERIKAKEQHLREAEAERRSLQPLLGQLHELAREGRADGPTRSGAPRVLLFTGRGMWSRDKPLVDALLYHALRRRGATCMAVLCGAALPACEVETVAHDAADPLLARGRPRICTRCVGDGRRIFEALGVPFRTMSDVLGRGDQRRSGEVVSRLSDEELFDLRHEGTAVGAHARATVMRYLLSGRLSETPTERALARRFLESALLVRDSAERLIREFEPDVIVANHGIYNMSGVFMDVAADHGARTVAWNRGYRRNTVIMSHGKSYHYEMMDEPTSEWDRRQLTDDEREQLDAYLASRNRGSMDWITYHPHPIEDRATLVSTLGIDASRPLIGLFTNVNWDAQIAYPQNAFKDQLSWLIQTIRHFRARPDLQLVIRVHPAETKDIDISRQRMTDEIGAAFPTLPPNVYVIPPESDLSSYTLAEMIDAGIVFATKFGLEAAVRGVPVIVAGDAWIRGKGFTYDASTPEEYERILSSIDGLPRLSPELVERARLYAHHFFFRRSIPIPVELGDSTLTDAPMLDLASLEELGPGRNAAVDVICSGILEGRSFVYDGSFDRSRSGVGVSSW